MKCSHTIWLVTCNQQDFWSFYACMQSTSWSFCACMQSTRGCSHGLVVRVLVQSPHWPWFTFEGLGISTTPIFLNTLNCKWVPTLLGRDQRWTSVLSRRVSTTALSFVECGSSVVECRTRNQVSPGLSPHLLPFRRLGIFVLFTDAPVDSAV